MVGNGKRSCPDVLVSLLTDGNSYCDNRVGNGASVVSGTDPSTTGCNVPCAGNSTEYCGGGSRLNLYQTNGTISVVVAVGPVIPQTVNSWSYAGCYSESSNGRALGGKLNPIPRSSVSVENCTDACAGYTYAGMEYAQECYCANAVTGGSLINGSTPAMTGCTMTCAANSTEYCGGPNRLSVYRTNPTVVASNTTTSAPGATSLTGPVTVGNFSGWSYLGCYSEATNMRALSDASFVSSTINVQTCAQKCAGASFFGVEYSRECYCGSKINAGSVLQAGSTPDVTGCSLTCAADSGSFCGGGNRLNMYAATPMAGNATATGTASVSSNSTSSTSSPISTTMLTTSSTSISSTPTTPSTTMTPTPGQIINNFAYVGCANDTTNPRALATASYTDKANMTTESCTSFCAGQGYALAGTEYSSECYCANRLGMGAITGQTGCSMPCTGNRYSLCGGSGRLSLWNNTAYASPAVVPRVGSYVSHGCYPEATAGRLLGGPSYTNATGMTVESCVTFCAANNSPYAGLEFASQCFCGTGLSTNATSTNSCGMICSGNRLEYCGGRALLNIYYNDPSNATGPVVS